MNHRMKGIIMAAGGAGLWGLMSIFSRVLGAADYTSLEIAYVRCLIAGTGLALINWKKDPSILRVSKRAVITSVLFGTVTFTVGFLSYAYSVQRIPAAMTAVLAFTSPIWTCFIGVFVFRERIQGKKIFAIICCLLGAVLITDLLGAQNLRFDLLGMGAAVLNGVGLAVQVCVPRYFEKQYRKDTMLTYGFLGAAAFMALFVDHGKILNSFTGSGGMKILLSVLALSVLCTLLANTIVVKSASYVSSATTTILASMEIVVGALVGLILFHETLTLLQIVGAVIIVVASLGMELAEKPGSGNHVEKK
jgi:drug/metabolite transporter (DMT)-like permease